MNKKSKPTAIEPKLSKAQVVQLAKANLPLVEIKNLGLKHLSLNSKRNSNHTFGVIAL